MQIGIIENGNVKMKKIIAEIITVVMLFFYFVTFSSFITTNSVFAQQSTYPSPYPWSKVSEATGDYIADSYDGIAEGNHVFESVSIDRLLDILSSEGDYYIVFGGPSIASSQKILHTINEQAKANGITKIYHFNPILDDYQLDITNASGDVAANFKIGSNNITKIWDEIVALLPSDSPERPVIDAYSSEDTLLFIFEKDSDTQLISDTEIKSTYLFRNSDIAGYDETFEKSEIQTSFMGGGSSVINSSIRSQYDYFKRVYGGAASYRHYNPNGTQLNPTASVLGSDPNFFSISDFPNGAGFNFRDVSYNELLNILNSTGDYIIFFAFPGCPNTQAIINQVALNAKKSNKQVIVYNPSLGQNVVFGTGININNVIKNVANTGEFPIRDIMTSTDKKYTYLYGELLKYFPNLITEDNSIKGSSITYYPNGDLSGIPTSIASWSDDVGEKNAKRLQVPFLLKYDKSKTSATVTEQWIHKNTQNNDGTYKEYMMQLPWVKKTPKAVDASKVALNNIADGMNNIDFSSEGILALQKFFDGDAVIKDPDVIDDPTVTKDPDVIDNPTVIKNPDVNNDPTIINNPDIINDPTVIKAPAIIKNPTENDSITASAGKDKTTPSKNNENAETSNIRVTNGLSSDDILNNSDNDTVPTINGININYDEIPIADGLENKTKKEQKEDGGFPLQVGVAAFALGALAFGIIGIKTKLIKV